MNTPTPPAAPVPDVWTVRRVLEWTTGHLAKHGSDTPRLDAEILLAHCRQCRRIQLYTQYDDPLTDAVRAQMRGLVQRRAQREPVAYLVGHREFFSLDFQVTGDVLIPRPDTETLVMEALTFLKPQSTPRVLDLCTGSGCVAIAIAKNAPGATVTAVDLSPAAVAMARKNVEQHQLGERVEVLEGDLFAPLTAGTEFDLIVSNPPYIPAGELATLDEDVRKYEPLLALDGGPDGLDLIRRLLAEASGWLRLGGVLAFEFTPEQRDAVLALATSEGWQEPRAIKDAGQRWRVAMMARGGN